MGKQNWLYLQNESENQKSYFIFFQLGHELRARVKSSLDSGQLRTGTSYFSLFLPLLVCMFTAKELVMKC